MKSKKDLQVLVGLQGRQRMIKSWIRERREEMSKHVTHHQQKRLAQWSSLPKSARSDTLKVKELR